jgi:hypothetical protein
MREANVPRRTVVQHDRRWESALSELPRTRRHLFLRAYGDEVTIGISHAVGAVPGILRFRLVQREATKFDLELSLLEDADFEPAAEQAVAALRSALRGYEIRPVHRQDMALATGGKHRVVVPLRSAG